MKFIKKNLKNLLIQRQHRIYGKKVLNKRIFYDKWIRQQEEKLEIVSDILGEDKKNLTNDFQNLPFGGKKSENEGNHSQGFEAVERGKKGSVLVISLKFLEENWESVLENNNTETLILTIYEGEASKFALPLIEKTFSQNENIILIYGDEDVQIQGERSNPWFKPDWSPDRFLSSFYFGGLIAVRRKELAQAWKAYNLTTNDIRLRLYEVLLSMIRIHGGFSNHGGENPLPVFHIRQVLFHSKEPGYEQIKDLTLPESLRGLGADNPILKEPTLVSIIIPSKDNPEVLFCCIHSFLERTHTSCPAEVVVVDNGSSEDNRQKIEKELDNLKKNNKNEIEFTYLYQPMEFNFSRMCNLGAEKAKGNFLLFLNDDMEILQADWLDRMMEKAALPYAGAVGAKLLYPDSDIIQHAGITNLRVGPAHKLQFLSDKDVHYYGMNRGVHNMLAVTGACLLLRREVFLQAGGFCQELAVAFNDVDLCYTLYEKGYYNIVRNDVVLYHHESLSRGKDGESEEKQLRLQREKDLLYERHQVLYGRDPFYHPYLTTDMLEADYSPACRYQVTLDMPWSEAAPLGKLSAQAREDSCLVVGMECAMDIYKWKYGVDASKSALSKENDSCNEEKGYYFQGYSFIIGSDNACYSKKLLLKNKKNGVIFEISVDERYRKDIKDSLDGQLNVDLTGFAAKLRQDALPNGNYQFGMLASDRCSRTKLINWSNWTLDVKN
ncbi:MAG: glycosyltransferase [Lachnospiraceae bacterium]|nr:glycosyltransferase [Lachnospiraceae bacterium]